MQQPGQHSPACGGPVEALRSSALCRSAAAATGCLVLAAWVGGCSLSFPIASIKPDGDDVTGSIRPVLGKMADEEDRRRAKAALSTALDPQGDGQSVRWENPTTGSKGAFAAVGHAYPADGRVCRAFREITRQDEGDKTVQGTACMVTAGQWAVTQTKPTQTKPSKKS